MAFKSCTVLCALALFVQSAVTQCINPLGVDALGVAPYGIANGLVAPGVGYAGYPGCGLNAIAPSIEYTATSGGGLTVTSASPIPPIGITVASENGYEGFLAIAGEVPFVGTTGMEGVVQSAGAGAVNHGCGNGVTAMANIGVVPSVGPIAPIAGNIGLGAPLGYGYGCGGYVL